MLTHLQLIERMLQHNGKLTVQFPARRHGKTHATKMFREALKELKRPLPFMIIDDPLKTEDECPPKT